MPMEHPLSSASLGPVNTPDPGSKAPAADDDWKAAGAGDKFLTASTETRLYSHC